MATDAKRIGSSARTARVSRSSLASSLELVRAYLTLLKPKITILLTACGVMAVLLAAAEGAENPTPDRVLLFAILGFMASGAAAALNHIFDRDIDARMGRTRKRPIPSGKVSPGNAAIFAVLLFAVSLLATWFLLGEVVATFMAVGALIYSGLYTLILKRRTPQNIVIGGLAGSCGVLAGWAVADPNLGLGAGIFALLVFVWTPAHFWGLAIARDSDYRAVSVPMLPQVKGVGYTARAILVYALATAVASLLLVPFTALGTLYGLLALALGAVNLQLCTGFARSPAISSALKVFKFSGAYLGLLVIAMGLDLVVGLVVPWA